LLLEPRGALNTHEGGGLTAENDVEFREARSATVVPAVAPSSPHRKGSGADSNPDWCGANDAFTIVPNVLGRTFDNRQPKQFVIYLTRNGRGAVYGNMKVIRELPDGNRLYARAVRDWRRAELPEKEQKH